MRARKSWLTAVVTCGYTAPVSVLLFYEPPWISADQILKGSAVNLSGGSLMDLLYAARFFMDRYKEPVQG